jgi:hypothetical protein
MVDVGGCGGDAVDRKVGGSGSSLLLPVYETIDVGGCGGDAVDKEGEAVKDHYHCHKSECLLMRGLMLVDVVAMQWAKKGRQFRIITAATNQNTC